MTGVHPVADVLAAVCVMCGALLSFASAVGIVRFPDTLSRLHAASKPQVLGLLLLIAGAVLRVGADPNTGMLLVAAFFALLTAPLIAHRVARRTYLEQRVDSAVGGRAAREARCQARNSLVIDEFADSPQA